jgi:glycosyltransferase involved in cell wall biosynthesis
VAVIEDNPIPPTTPLASVIVPVYNQAGLLARALDSVLMQQVGFQIEILVSDDCSTDNTVEVARAYQARHPDVIRVLRQVPNAGMSKNYFDLFAHCRGKYTAWLDADDYWTDPEKLTFQVQALESDPSISMCLHFVRVVTPEGHVRNAKIPERPAGAYGLADLVRQNFVPSCSAMFRRELYTLLPEWYFEMAPITDWPLWLLAARSGKVLLIDRIMADYTRADGSAFNKGELFCFSQEARFFERVESILPPEHHRLARQEKRKRYEAMAYLLRKQGDLVGSRIAAFRAFCSPSIFDSVYGKTKTLGMAFLREILWRVRGSKTTA